MRASGGELELRGVGARLGTKQVLDGLDLVLQPARVTALVGPNGAGKSTCLRLLSGVLQPSAGTVLVRGRGLRQWGRRELARHLAVVPQGAVLPAGFTAFDLVMMGRAPHIGFLGTEGAEDVQAVNAALTRTRAADLAKRRIEELSGGERQRVLLARALAQEPSWLLLDEPTNHLDIRHQVELLRFIRRESSLGLGAFVVLHDLNLAARVADRIVVMADGNVVADGAPGEVLSEGMIRQVYAADVRVHTGPDGLPVVVPVLGSVLFGMGPEGVGIGAEVGAAKGSA